MPSIPASVPTRSVTNSRVAPGAAGPPASGSSTGTRIMCVWIFEIFTIHESRFLETAGARAHRVDRCIPDLGVAVEQLLRTDDIVGAMGRGQVAGMEAVRVMAGIAHDERVRARLW